MEAVLGVSLIAGVLILCTWLFIRIVRRDRKRVHTLKESYDQALKSGDKKAALEAGRKYYSALRGGKLSVYDEQAIANDLNAMS